jgi:DNA-binding NtrC family response regulator
MARLESQMAGLLTGVRVVVVEDLEQSLSFQAAVVHTTANAAEAIAALDGVDIVVTDFAMDEHDGIWLLKQVGARHALCP